MSDWEEKINKAYKLLEKNNIPRDKFEQDEYCEGDYTAIYTCFNFLGKEHLIEEFESLYDKARHKVFGAVLIY